MRYLSVCSGIEAASVAWHPLGWEPVAFAEVEPFPSAVLAHHYPNVPNLGDMTRYEEWPDATFDVLVGGTPCQSFSVAGKRGGMDDPRGQLAYAFAGIAARYRPEWIVWENVPGVLSSNRGRDFAGFVRGLAERGYQCAWRIFDAQFFGVPQRRRRLFLVGNSGGWQRAAAVLFERESMLGNPPPSRKARQVAPTIPARSLGGGGLGTDFDCDGGVIQAFGGNNQAGPIDVATARNACASASGRMDFESETFLVQPVAHSLRGEGFDASEDGTGRGTPLVPVAYSIMPMNSGKDYKARETDVAQPLMAGGPVGGNQGGDFIAQPVGVFQDSEFGVRQYDSAGTLDTDGHSVAVAISESGSACAACGVTMEIGWGQWCDCCGHDHAAPAVAFDTYNQSINPHTSQTIKSPQGAVQESVGTVLQSMQVRRLTPVECERLQGFPDGYTAIPWRNKPADQCPDGPRYKALGNSMAVPVMRWIGQRIDKLMEVTK